MTDCVHCGDHAEFTVDVLGDRGPAVPVCRDHLAELGGEPA